jgi:hypothetical protein
MHRLRLHRSGFGQKEVLSLVPSKAQMARGDE